MKIAFSHTEWPLPHFAEPHLKKKKNQILSFLEPLSTKSDYTESTTYFRTPVGTCSTFIFESEAYCPSVPPLPFPVAASMGGQMHLPPPPPPVGGSAPHLPPVRRKKWSKSAIFGKFLDFCPTETHFAPSMPLPKKKKNLVPHCPSPIKCTTCQCFNTHF